MLFRSTFAVAKGRKQNKLHVIFQPHRFTRTEKLWDEFVELFARADNRYDVSEIFIVDIYPASEKPLPHITSEKLVAAIKLKNPSLQIHHQTSFEVIADHFKKILSPGDLLLTIGAGKAYSIGEFIAENNKPQV